MNSEQAQMMAFVKGIRRILASGLGSSKLSQMVRGCLGRCVATAKTAKTTHAGTPATRASPSFYAVIDKAPVPVSKD